MRAARRQVGFVLVRSGRVAVSIGTKTDPGPGRPLVGCPVTPGSFWRSGKQVSQGRRERAYLKGTCATENAARHSFPTPKQPGEVAGQPTSSIRPSRLLDPAPRS